MHKQKIVHILALFSSLSFLPSFLLAATVPEGVKLHSNQTLNRGNYTEPETLDPGLATGRYENNIIQDLFEPLLTFDATGKTQAGAATHWETQDNITFTFYLRENAKWSDGEPVTAHDFVYSFQRNIDPKTASQYADYFKMMNLKNAQMILEGKAKPEQLGVQALDNNKLQLTLASPLGYLPDMLCHYIVMPLPKKAIEKHGSLWTRPGNIVSNGAYQLKKWVVNERIELEKNPHYWDAKNVVVAQVNHLPIPPGNPEMNRYLAGDLDITSEIPSERFPELKKKYPQEVYTTAKIASYFYIPNTQKKPFDDVRVRKALALGLDQKIIAYKVTGRNEVPLYNIMPTNISGLQAKNPDWSQWSPDKRKQQAQQLLKEAGYDRNNPLRFELLYDTKDLHKKIAIAVASMWQQNLGVQVELKNQEWKVYLSSRHNGQFDVVRAGWQGDYNEPSTMLNLVVSDNQFNDGKYANAQLDALMAKSMQEVNPEKRAEIYQQVLAIMDADMPIIPVFQENSPKMVKSYVGGMPQNPMDVIYSKDLYIIAH